MKLFFSNEEIASVFVLLNLIMEADGIDHPMENVHALVILHNMGVDDERVNTLFDVFDGINDNDIIMQKVIKIVSAMDVSKKRFVSAALFSMITVDMNVSGKEVSIYCDIQTQCGLPTVNPDEMLSIINND